MHRYEFPLITSNFYQKHLFQMTGYPSTVHITTECEEIDKDELLLKTIKPQSKSNAQQIR